MAVLHLFQEVVPSPIGNILLVTDEDEVLRALDFEELSQRMHRLFRTHYGDYVLLPHAGPKASEIRRDIERYFAGELDAIDDLPVRTNGTAFQQEVWRALRSIPTGETTSYGKLAAQMGNPNAMRAVGLANALNPISIVVPCHRLIGANGALTGYAGGLHRKQWLLRHESASAQTSLLS